MINITLDSVQKLAPDRASVQAAKKLLQPQHWPVKACCPPVIWGACRGSGKNPYHIVFNTDNAGYKCTCPSRKFPCKHVLALLWQYAEDAPGFVKADVPDWVHDWLKRQRKSKPEQGAKATQTNAAPKNETNKAAGSAGKSKAATDAAVSAGLLAYQQWLNDILRFGLARFQEHAMQRCQEIILRLLDAKAGALAARLQTLPDKLAQAKHGDPIRVIINELGKTAWLIQAWQNNPDDPDVRRALLVTENRESVLINPAALRKSGLWQITAQFAEAQRDGLMRYSTWLYRLNAVNSPLRFALLQEYVRAGGNKHPVSAMALGECITAEMVFYPSRYPCRAILARQYQPAAMPEQPEPPTSGQNHFYRSYQQALAHLPWLEAMPYRLPAGRLIHPSGGACWWQAEAENPPLWQLPVAAPAEKTDKALRYRAQLSDAFVLWDGITATLGSCYSPIWGYLE